MAINIDEIVEVVDNRVVELNALKSVKLSSLSKNKRPAAKANKAAAQFILDRWDDDEELGRLVADEETKTTATQAWEIAKSRYEQLTQKPQVEPESKDEPTAEVADEPKEVAQNEANEDDSNAANETDSTAEVTTPEPDKKAASKSKHVVGDVHPNGKWIWTEYKPGKFDWRTIPDLKHQGERTDKKKGTKKQAKKSASKPTKAVEKKPMTIDEWIASPKLTSNKSKMSDAQKEAFKFINRGYRVSSDKNFFVKDGDSRHCSWEAVVAMLKRYGVDYVPEGLVL